MKSRILFFFFIIFLPVLGCGQSLSENQANAENADPASYVGMTIENLISRFGIPSSVYPVRGLEDWQDDVVFVYEEGDFYIFRDRVWQLGLTSYRGINTGDPGSVVMLILDDVSGLSRLQSPPGSISFSIYESSWPMILRFDFDDAGRIRGIFIFRSDL